MSSDEKDKLFFEQLSAYLDGELTPNQSAKVEQRLADDPAARAMLDELRQVSGQVGSLPIEKVSPSFTDQVLREIERDVLLSDTESFGDGAGRNHLFLKRMIAAAAVIMLTGSIGYIVYSVLFRSPGDFFKAKQPVEPVVALNRPMRELPQAEKAESDSIEAAKPADALLPAEVTENESSSRALVKVNDYSCSSVELVVHAGDDSVAGAMVEDLLGRSGIDQHIRSPIDTMGRQYAFVCSPEQLRTFFDALDEQETVRIDLVLTDSRSTSRLLITDVRQDQLMALAAQSDRDRQFASALKQRWGKLAPTGESAVADASLSIEASLPDWLSEMIVRSEPEMTDLRSLGMAGAAAGPVCPPETLKGHQAESPILAANEPARKAGADLTMANGMGAGAFEKKESEVAASDKKAVPPVHCVAVILNVRSGPAETSPKMDMPGRGAIEPLNEWVPGEQPKPKTDVESSPVEP